MPESKNEEVEVEVDGVNEIGDDPNALESKENIIRRLKKALRLAGKLQTKLDFEKEVSKELARRNENLKKEIESQSQSYDSLKEAFHEMYLQFDDLLLRYDEMLNVETPQKGTDSFLEASRDYDEKLEFLQNVRSRSGVDKSRKSLHSRGIMLDDDQNVNLLRMSGTSFFRTSLRRNSISGNEKDEENTIKTKRENVPSEKESIRKLKDCVSSGSEQNLVSSQSDSSKNEAELDSMPSHSPNSAASNDSGHSRSTSFTSTPLFEHFLVIGVPVDPAAEMAGQILRKNEKLSDRLKSQVGNFFKRSISNSQIGKQGAFPSPQRTKSVDSVTPPPPKSPPKKGTLAGKWGELSKSIKAAGTQAPRNSPDTRTLQSGPGSGKPQEDSTAEGEDVVVPVSSTRNTSMSYTEPCILYRYPPDADPPPSEVCDFCLPAGGRLRHLATPTDREQSALEMLYGYGQSQRSSRCFIFVLEDKTVDMSLHSPNEETGEHTGRLFGICVVSPRLLNPFAPSNSPSGKLQNQKPPGAVDVEFEAAVCYCFVTRFPMFEFFFQVLWNIVAFERISRMIDVSEHSEETSEIDLYRYVPANVYDYVMMQLSTINPPKYGEEISLQVDSSLHRVSYTRKRPECGQPEYFQRSAEWALPPLLHWLDAKTIVWALSLLLSEVKVIILGRDAATVSCAVIGLTALLNPFQWVSPMIPILPIKHLDFIESPVPIIAGIVLDNDSPDAISFQGNAVTPLNVLRQCDDGDVVAVLDIAGRDIFTLSGYKKQVSDLLMPKATSLIDRIEEIISSSGVRKLQNNVSTHPPYEITKLHMENCNAIQSCVNEQIKSIASSAKAKAQEVLDGQVSAAEEKVKAQLEQLSTLKDQTQKRRASLNAVLFGTIEESKDEDSDNDSDSSGSNEVDASASLDSPIGSGYTIPILSLTSMKYPPSGTKHDSKFYERFVTTQMYSEYDMEFERMMQSVEAAIAADCDIEEGRNASSSRSRRFSRRQSVRSAGPHGGASKIRSRSLYIKSSDDANEANVEHSKGSYIKSDSTLTKQSRRTSRSSSDVR